MISQSYLLRSLAGAWQVFFWNEEALEKFDFSASGFWRSFVMPVLLTPLYFFILLQLQKMAIEISQSEAGFDLQTLQFTPKFYVLELIRYLLGIAFFPAVMVYITRVLGLGQRYAPLVIVYNWTGSALLIGMFAVSVLYFIGLFSFGMTSMILLVMMLMWPYYMFAGFRQSSGATVGTAIGLVIIEILLGQILVLGQSLFQ